MEHSKEKKSSSGSKSSTNSAAGKKSSTKSAPLKVQQAIASRKRKDIPQLREQAKQSIPPLKVLDVPSMYQEHGGFNMEAAAALAAQMNCTVEQLLSSKMLHYPLLI